MRILRRILFILFLILVLIATTVTVFLLTFDLNHYKTFVEKKLSQALNRTVNIESMHTKLSLVPTISISGFKVLNNEPFQDANPLLSIQNMDAVLELVPLLNSQINIQSVHIQSADVNLINKEGHNNWSVSNSDKEGTSASVPNAKLSTTQNNLHLNSATIEALNFKYQDEKGTRTVTANKLELKVLHVLSGEITYNKQAFNFTLNTDPIFNLLNQTPNFPIDLKVKSRLLDFTLNAKIGNLKEFKDLHGSTTLKITNVKNFMNFFGVKNNLIPTQTTNLSLQFDGNLDKLNLKKIDLNVTQGKDLKLTASGTATNILKNPILQLNFNTQLFKEKLTELWHIEPMSIEGDLTFTPQSVKIKSLVADANRSDLTLNGELKKKDNKYVVNGSISSNFLDIYDFITKATPSSTASEANKVQKVDTNIPLPWSTLKQLEGQVSLKIQHLKPCEALSDYIGLAATPSITNAKLTMPFDLSLLSGRLTGTLEANIAQQSLTLKTQGNQLNLNGVRPLRQELQDVVLSTLITASTKGPTIQSLLDNLNAHIVMETHQGLIVNKWFANLPKALNLMHKKSSNVNFSNSESKIQISCAAANLNIKNGILSGEDQLALETNTLNVIAGGTVNLKKQTLDVTIKPSLPEQETDQLSDLVRMIRLTGTFDKMTPRVDTQKVATTLLESGLKQLAGKAQDTPQKAASKGQLCQDVLGSYASIQAKQATKTSATPKATTATPQSQSTQAQENKTQQFQQQLLDSLFQVLTPQ